jgi:hypothetical protein
MICATGTLLHFVIIWILPVYISSCLGLSKKTCLSRVYSVTKEARELAKYTGSSLYNLVVSLS